VGNTSIAGPRLSSHQFNRFTRLKILSIAHNACYNVLKEIAESTLAKNLQMLDVSRNFITEEFIDPRHLVRFINLQELNLSFNPLKDLGFVLLAKSGLAARLRILKLSNTLLTDAVFVPEFLDAFINLKELYVAGNYITAKGLINLANSKLVLRLNALDIDANAIQATVLNLFNADFPQIKLVRLH
jgi:Leucine-rich repeat (LRR) protein